MEMMALPDEASLIERAKTDSEAFRQLYERYLPELYRYTYYRTGNPTVAEDVVAETFLRVWRNLRRYEQRGVPFRYWLYRIAGSILADIRPRQMPVAGLGWETVAENDAAGQVELRLDLARQLRSLPQAQQEAINLRYVQDLSLKQVAEIMGRSEGAVKQLAWRGLRTLRERMKADVEKP
jgi:RNA polymerase sigma-70 factor (ECF subfamily)